MPSSTKQQWVANHEVYPDSPGSMPCLACSKFFPVVKIPAHQRSCIKNTCKRYSNSLPTYNKIDLVGEQQQEAKIGDYVAAAGQVLESIDKVSQKRQTPSSYQRPNKSTTLVSSPPDDRKPCHICSRRFNDDALGRHLLACEKLNSRRATVFDSARARAHGTGLDLFTKHKKPQPDFNDTILSKKKALKSTHDDTLIPTRTTESGDKSKPKWQLKHEQLIRSLRAARGDPSGFVPSEPDPDLVQCPVCDRRFQKMSAERHIPFCKQAADLQKFKKPAGAVSSKRVQASDALRRRTSFRPPPPTGKGSSTKH